MDTLHFLANGFLVALQPYNLAFAFIGVVIGTAVGILPGIGPSSGVALLIPITAVLTGGLDPEAAATSGIILLAGVFYGAMYGGSTTSILINTPGESSSVITALDGYQMAKQGRGGVALSIAAIGSFLAGIFALVMLLLLAQPLSELAIQFGPAEYFSLVVLGLAAVTGLAGKSMIKALIMMTAGLAASTIGVDALTGVGRFTFEIPSLYQGLEFITIAVGFFALGEVFRTILDNNGNETIAKIGRLLPTKKDFRDSVPAIARGSILGFFVGILPGAGPTLSSFMSYTLEKKSSKTPERFGKGAIEGVAGPESANNAASGGAMIPLLVLGIPSSATTAVLMGAFIMYNVQPGPLLFEKYPTVVWGVIASMFVGNLMLLILNMPLIKVFAKLVETPPQYLLPIILAICVFGVYAVQVNVFNLVLMLVCGILGYLLVQNDFPVAPLILGRVLGPMLENNLRRALTLSDGDYIIFLSHPISAFLLATALLWIVVPVLLKKRGRKVIVNEAE
ncbi:MAG TPA: tripartite tricarboxylate transporter permease [Selenomonadales bacterium]|nr:tripartite tricarboxylate transporter permease [Selenomonadales bacterium]